LNISAKFLSKLILTFLSYTVSKLVHFLRHSADVQHCITPVVEWSVG